MHFMRKAGRYETFYCMKLKRVDFYSEAYEKVLFTSFYWRIKKYRLHSKLKKSFFVLEFNFNQNLFRKKLKIKIIFREDILILKARKSLHPDGSHLERSIHEEMFYEIYLLWEK